MPGQFSANASMLGYFYQARYALYLLLIADRQDEISIERFDDIAFETGGTPTQLLQAKHHINQTGNLSNYSSDLWKTLRVWSTAVKKKEINLNRIQLVLITTEKADDDNVAARLRPLTAKDSKRDEANALVTLLHIANTSNNKTNEPGYAAFKALTEEEQKALLKCVQVLDAAPSITDVYDRILDKLRLSTRAEFLIALMERVEGWWFKKVIQHLSVDSISTISYQELLAHVNDISEQFFRDNLPIDFLDAIAPSEEELSYDQRIFIQQLRIVTVGEPRISRAINDYYRAFEQRSRWMREDLLGVGELDLYEKRLVDEWARLHEIMLEEIGDDGDEERIRNRGRLLFNKVDTELDLPIRPQCKEPYVMRGSYHMLANELKVGWHAKFVERLSEILVTA